MASHTSFHLARHLDTTAVRTASLGGETKQNKMQRAFQPVHPDSSKHRACRVGRALLRCNEPFAWVYVARYKLCRHVQRTTHVHREVEVATCHDVVTLLVIIIRSLRGGESHTWYNATFAKHNYRYTHWCTSAQNYRLLGILLQRCRTGVQFLQSNPGKNRRDFSDGGTS